MNWSAKSTYLDRDQILTTCGPEKEAKYSAVKGIRKYPKPAPIRNAPTEAEMIGTMKHFAASVASYDAGLLGQLAGVEAVEVAPGRS